jgi:hypothetical protein
VVLRRIKRRNPHSNMVSEERVWLRGKSALSNYISEMKGSRALMPKININRSRTGRKVNGSLQTDGTTPYTPVLESHGEKSSSAMFAS